jgi:uncharacterized protein
MNRGENSIYICRLNAAFGISKRLQGRIAPSKHRHTTHMDISTVLLFALAGAIVGLSVGLTGIGAGSIMTPILTGFLNLAPGTAVAHALAGAAVAKMAGVAVHGRQANIRWRALTYMLAGAVPSAVAALVWLSYVQADPSLNKLIRQTIGWAVLVTIILLLLRPRLVAWAKASHSVVLREGARRALLLCAGLVIGPLVMVSSVGAGVIGATVLILLHADMEPAELAGTDIGFALPLAILGAIGHTLMGAVQLTFLLALLAGYLPAIALGSAVANKVPQRWLAWLLSGLLGMAALRMIG